RDFISVAAILGPFGAFLGWWAWLFWLALKADRFMRYLAVAAFLALAVLIFALQRPNLRLAQRFQQEGLPTQAVVTGLFPNDHNRIGYSYIVDGVPYQGRDHAPGLASDFRVGDRIRVHYLRSAPSVSASRYPTDTTGSALGASLLGACWLI